MAVNMSRSMNSDLAEGMSDGSYKKVVMDRGGVVEPGTYDSRRDLSDLFHGIHEAPNKTLGDGTSHTTPNFGETPQPDSTRW